MSCRASFLLQVDNTLTPTVAAPVSAPAKIILFGEHAVVYGKPAIAVPFRALQARVRIEANDPGEPEWLDLHIPALQMRTTMLTMDAMRLNARAEDQPQQAFWAAVYLTLRHLGIEHVPPAKLTIESDIPIASGLGSGAAITTALIRAILQVTERTISDADLNALVFEIEKLHHGTPSGIDNTVIVYDRPVYFIKDQPLHTFTPKVPLHLLTADTGIAASTKESVSAVRALVEGQPTQYRPYIDQIGQIAEEARQQIEDGLLNGVGHLMDLNQNCLQALTVSSPELDKLIKVARDAGAAGAKLSGGGRGGNMIALINPADEASITEALKAAGARSVWHTVVE